MDLSEHPLRPPFSAQECAGRAVRTRRTNATATSQLPAAPGVPRAVGGQFLSQFSTSGCYRSHLHDVSPENGGLRAGGLSVWCCSRRRVPRSTLPGASVGLCVLPSTSSRQRQPGTPAGVSAPLPLTVDVSAGRREWERLQRRAAIPTSASGSRLDLARPFAGREAVDSPTGEGCAEMEPPGSPVSWRRVSVSPLNSSRLSQVTS